MKYNARNTIKYLFLSSLALFLFCALVFTGCSSSSSSSKSSSKSTSNSKTEQSQSYDSRWPTTDSELNAIAEDKRWYTAKNRVGTNGYIAGPVKRVNTASSSKGKPTYIDIGESYPSKSRAQIVIWDKDASKFSKELASCKKSGTWIMVKGNITSYDGVAEISTGSGNSVSFTVWENKG